MSIYIDLLLLAAIVTWVVDCSGFTDTLLDLASSFTRRFGYGPVKNLRPFTCSLCSVWWSCLLWCILRNSFTLPTIACCAALAGLSKTLAKVFIFITESLDLVIGKLMDRWLY